MTKIAENPRADVNGDGIVNAADILEIRRPGNWGLPTKAPEPPAGTLYRYDGTDPWAAAIDVRGDMEVIGADIISTAYGIVAWAPQTARLRVEGCKFETEGYGLFTRTNNLVVRDSEFYARNRDPIRIAGGTNLLFEGIYIGGTLSAASWRIHGDTRDVTIRSAQIYATNPWALDLGEEYRGAGGVVRNVLIENVDIYATAATRMGMRIRAQNVTLRNVRGHGFDRTDPGVGLFQFEKHSCEPTGCRVENCTVDDGRKVVVTPWVDTVVV